MNLRTLLHERYFIEDYVAKGGMGSVYIAEDRHLHKRVAIKVTPGGSPTALRAFEREGKLLSRLRHQALPVVSDSFPDGKNYFLVMDYIRGEDLATTLRKQNNKPFEYETLLSITTQLIDVLSYLHSSDIVHRDVKPANLKFSSSGQLYLLDFGLAKGTLSESSTRKSSIHGYTQDYASIEQLQGVETDQRADIFSAGATIYHLATGNVAEPVLIRITSVVSGASDPLREISDMNPVISHEFSAIIHRCLEIDRQNRYQSANDVREAINMIGESKQGAQKNSSLVMNGYSSPYARQTPVVPFEPHKSKYLTNGAVSASTRPTVFKTRWTRITSAVSNSSVVIRARDFYEERPFTASIAGLAILFLSLIVIQMLHLGGHKSSKVLNSSGPILNEAAARMLMERSMERATIYEVPFPTANMLLSPEGNDVILISDQGIKFFPLDDFLDKDFRTAETLEYPFNAPVSLSPSKKYLYATSTEKASEGQTTLHRISLESHTDERFTMKGDSWGTVSIAAVLGDQIVAVSSEQPGIEIMRLDTGKQYSFVPYVPETASAQMIPSNDYRIYFGHASSPSTGLYGVFDLYGATYKIMETVTGGGTPFLLIPDSTALYSSAGKGYKIDSNQEKDLLKTTSLLPFYLATLDAMSDSTHFVYYAGKLFLADYDTDRTLTLEIDDKDREFTKLALSGDKLFALSASEGDASIIYVYDLKEWIERLDCSCFDAPETPYDYRMDD